MGGVGKYVVNEGRKAGERKEEERKGGGRGGEEREGKGGRREEREREGEMKKRRILMTVNVNEAETETATATKSFDQSINKQKEIVHSNLFACSLAHYLRNLTDPSNPII